MKILKKNFFANIYFRESEKNIHLHKFSKIKQKHPPPGAHILQK